VRGLVLLLVFWAALSAQSVRLELRGEPMLGRRDAPLTMIEFTDYQCGFCRRFHVTTFPELKKKYIDTGVLRFASRDLPLDFHQQAFGAANAAHCAGEQDRFWEMRDVLSSNAADLGPPALLRYAQGLGLNLAGFQACVQTVRYKARIERDMAQAESLGISGTPSFVLGRTTREGVEGNIIVGAHPPASFEKAIRQALAHAP
jgi:protein-disulfide isomerase